MTDVARWVREVVTGPAGFQSFAEHEWLLYDDRDVAVAEFVVRCLGNVKCEGSHDVVEAIREQRTRNKVYEPSACATCGAPDTTGWAACSEHFRIDADE